MSAWVRERSEPVDSRSAAARLVWIALPGPDVDDESRALLARGAGGVVLFGRNITSGEQLARLTADLRRVAHAPLHIAIDHEGGHVARMGAPLTRFPSAMAIAATGSEDLAYSVARAAGEELVAFGIDVNLAPVLDVALDPRNPSVGVRSFGSSPELVARFGAAAVRGFRDAGVAATAKHFPGNGRTPIDPHVALPTVAGGLDRLRRSDLPPFRAAIDAGVEMVMVSHVAYDGLTDGLPSTLSAAMMHELLRTELGFQGVVITDAMVMRALADRHPIPEACTRSVAAGADVVVPLEVQTDVITAMEAAISSGRIPAGRVAGALDRIGRLDRLRGARPAADYAALPDAGHLELAQTVAQRSLTLVAGAELLPLGPTTSVAVIEFASRRPSPVEEGSLGTASLAAALRRHMPRVAEVIVDGKGDLAAAERAAVDAAHAAEFVLFATRDAYMWPEEGALIARVVPRAVDRAARCGPAPRPRGLPGCDPTRSPPPAR